MWDVAATYFTEKQHSAFEAKGRAQKVALSK